MNRLKTAEDYGLNTNILKHYDKSLYSKARSQHAKVGWNSEEDQFRRFKVMLKYVRNGDSLLDYGCGNGGLMKYFKEIGGYGNVDYTGVDINNKLIEDAKRLYGDGFFNHIDSYKDISKSFDWVVASGVFTVHTSTNDMYNTIDHLYKLSHKGVSFNLLMKSYKYENEKDNNSRYIDIRGYDINEILNYFKSIYGKNKVGGTYTSNHEEEVNIYIEK